MTNCPSHLCPAAADTLPVACPRRTCPLRDPTPPERRTNGAPVIIGLDLSLVATGIAGNAGDGWADTIRPNKGLSEHQRLNWIRRTITDQYLNGYGNNWYVVVEGPAFAAQGRSVHQLAGLWWIVTHSLWARRIPFAVVPPTTLKKYATGSGASRKDDVLRECTRRFPWFTGDNNAADAAWLAAMAADHHGRPMTVVPQRQRDSLAAVQWPDVTS